MTATLATSPGNRLGYVPGLDGLRAIAVSGVVLFHAAPHQVRGGFLGVSSFFTLSGFLITSVLLAELTASGSVDLGAFWTRRIRRLAPASLTVIVLSILITHTRITGWGDGFLTTDAWAGALHVMNWHVAYWIPATDLFRGIGPIGPYWSLAVEEQFYIAMAILFLLVRRSRRPRPVLVGVFTAAWVVALVSAVAFDGSIPQEMFGTHIRMAELAAGCLLALAVERWGRPAAGTLTATLGAAGVITTLALFALADEDQAWVLAGGFALLSLVHVVTIVGVVGVGRSTACCTHPVLRWLGFRSYGLYLVHWPIIRILRSDRVHLGGWWLVAIQVATSLIVAEALFRLVEDPMRRRWRADSPTVIGCWLGATAATCVLALSLN